MSAPDPLQFLRTLEPFVSWTTHTSLAKALQELADRCQLWSFESGDLIRFPDESGDGPCWVAQGCLVSVRKEGTPVYVGIREALASEPGATVKGQTRGFFFAVPQNSWNQWLSKWPLASAALSIPRPQSIPSAFLHSPLILEPGELLTEVFRKSWWFWVRRATIPLVFLLTFTGFGALLSMGLADRVPVLALWFLPGCGIALCLALVLLVTWEWRTSVLAITDRALLVRQIDVWAHRSDFEKFALDRIREAVFVRSGWIDAIFGLVTLEIEGDSPRGRLSFRGLSHSSRFLTAMNSLRQSLPAEGLRRAQIRLSLGAKMGTVRTAQLVKAAVIVPQVQPSFRRRASWRTESDKGVWFRRHPWLVWKRSMGPLGWIVLLAFLAALATGLWPQGWGTVIAVSAVLALVPAGRIVWEFWDWLDDRLSIQGDKVIMVHRRPLWLGEVRQEGLLSEMEQVGVLKPTLSALLLDYGTVTISLGGSEPLVFEHAVHPEWVQNELFYQRSRLAQERKAREAQHRIDEMSEVIDTWTEAEREGYFEKGPQS